MTLVSTSPLSKKPGSAQSGRKGEGPLRADATSGERRLGRREGFEKREREDRAARRKNIMVREGIRRIKVLVDDLNKLSREDRGRTCEKCDALNGQSRDKNGMQCAHAVTSIG